MNAFGLAPLLLIFPGVGFLLNALVGRRFVESRDRNIGERWSGWTASVMALLAFVIGLLLAASLVANDFHSIPDPIPLLKWIDIPVAFNQSLTVQWAMQIDTLSVVMILVVTGVGSLIHIYAIAT